MTATFWKVAAISGASTAAIGLLNAYAGVSGKALTLAGVSSFLSELVINNISSRVGFLILVNVLFLFMGTFMDINATILIMTPLLLPIAQSYGIIPHPLRRHHSGEPVRRFHDAALCRRNFCFHQDHRCHLRCNSKGDTGRLLSWA
mgnify:CR=1 FL=1